MALRRILVSVDLSNSSRAAIGYATFLADCYDSELDVLHVVPPTCSFDSAADVAEQRHCQAQSERLIRRLLDDIPSAAARRARILVEFGDPARVINEALSGYDLVMLNGNDGLDDAKSRHDNTPHVRLNRPGLEQRQEFPRRRVRSAAS